MNSCEWSFPARHVFSLVPNHKVLFSDRTATYGRLEYFGDKDEGNNVSPTVVFEGYFVDGHREGPGLLCIGDRCRVQCHWRCDYPDLGDSGAVSHMTLENGDIFVGLLSMITDGTLVQKADYFGLAWVCKVRFVPDTVGEMFLQQQRRRYCGEWQCGQRHGFGTESDVAGTYHFIGGFEYDSREGSGAVFHSFQKTVLSGSWRNGVVNGTAALHLPNRAAMIQSHDWSNIDRYMFDSATVVRSRLVDGIWEPLFVAFDNTLALSVAEGSSPPFSVVSHEGPSDTSSKPSSQIMKMSVIQLLRNIMAKDDFLSLLSTFQRTFYFLYGSCDRFLAASCLDTRYVDGNSVGAYPVPFPESWCCLQGLDRQTCLHGNVRERKYDVQLLQRAVSDVASFVFSVRLRLLSFLAAIPSACDVNVGRTILQMCWDAAFAAVAPLVSFMAHSLTKQRTAAVTIASSRCRQLDLDDFIGNFDFWFSSTDSVTKAKESNDSQPSSSSPPPSSPRNTTDRKACFLTSMEGWNLLWDSAVPRGPLTVERVRTSLGPLVSSTGSSKLVPSTSLQSLQALFNSTRDMARWLTRDRSPNSLPFVHEQLINYSILRFLHARTGDSQHFSLDGVVCVLLSLMSDSIDPALPGTLVESSRTIHAVEQVDGNHQRDLLDHNDSLDAHAMLSSESSDVEKQSSMQAVFQLQELLMGSQRVSTLSPLLRLHRWAHVVLPLDAVLLRLEYTLKVGMAKPASAIFDDDDEDDDDIQLIGARMPSMPCCRQMSEELTELAESSATTTALSELSSAVRDVVHFLYEAPVVLLRNLTESLQQSSHATNGSKPSLRGSVRSTTRESVPLSIWRVIRVPISAANWYRDIIPRFSHIAHFLALIGFQYELKFLVSSTSARTVAPEEASGMMVSLRRSSCRDSRCITSSCVSVTSDAASNSAEEQPWKIKLNGPLAAAAILESVIDAWEHAIYSSSMFLDATTYSTKNFKAPV